MPHLRNYGESGTSEGLWDCFGGIQLAIVVAEKKYMHSLAFSSSNVTTSISASSKTTFPQLTAAALLERPTYSKTIPQSLTRTRLPIVSGMGVLFDILLFAHAAKKIC